MGTVGGRDSLFSVCDNMILMILDKISRPLPSCFAFALTINSCGLEYVLSHLSLSCPSCSKAINPPLQRAQPCMVCPLKRSILHFALADAPIPTAFPTFHGVVAVMILPLSLSQPPQSHLFPSRSSLLPSRPPPSPPSSPHARSQPPSPPHQQSSSSP
jgi:hypothetical protein